MCVCVWQVTHANQVTSLLLNINPLGNKLNFSFFSKHVRPHPHIIQSWIDPGTAYFSPQNRAPVKHIPTVYERGGGREPLQTKLKLSLLPG